MSDCFLLYGRTRNQLGPAEDPIGLEESVFRCIVPWPSPLMGEG